MGCSGSSPTENSYSSPSTIDGGRERGEYRERSPHSAFAVLDDPLPPSTACGILSSGRATEKHHHSLKSHSASNSSCGSSGKGSRASSLGSNGGDLNPRRGSFTPLIPDADPATVSEAGAVEETATTIGGGGSHPYPSRSPPRNPLQSHSVDNVIESSDIDTEDETVADGRFDDKKLRHCLPLNDEPDTIASEGSWHTKVKSPVTPHPSVSTTAPAPTTPGTLLPGHPLIEKQTTISCEEKREDMSILTPSPLPETDLLTVKQQQQQEENDDDSKGQAAAEAKEDKLAATQKRMSSSVKRGSKVALSREGVMGKISITGDAKTSSSLSSVQSMWFEMSMETVNDFVLMNTHIEALLAYEQAVATAAMTHLPPQQGPTLADMHISTFTVGLGDTHISEIECPDIELLLTFTTPELKEEWFIAGGLIQSLPHKNRWLVQRWFEEIGTDIMPIEVYGATTALPLSSSDRSRPPINCRKGGGGIGDQRGGSHSAAGSRVGSDNLGLGWSCNNKSHQVHTNNNIPYPSNDTDALMSLSPHKNPQAVTGKNLYMNDKLLRQLESRLTRHNSRSRRHRHHRDSSTSDHQSGTASSSIFGSFTAGGGGGRGGGSAGTASSIGTAGTSLLGPLGQGCEVESRGAAGTGTNAVTPMDDAEVLEKERLQTEAVCKRQRLLEKACDVEATCSRSRRKKLYL